MSSDPFQVQGRGAVGQSSLRVLPHASDKQMPKGKCDLPLRRSASSAGDASAALQLISSFNRRVRIVRAWQQRARVKADSIQRQNAPRSLDLSGAEAMNESGLVEVKVVRGERADAQAGDKSVVMHRRGPDGEWQPVNQLHHRKDATKRPNALNAWPSFYPAADFANAAEVGPNF